MRTTATPTTRTATYVAAVDGGTARRTTRTWYKIVKSDIFHSDRSCGSLTIGGVQRPLLDLIPSHTDFQICKKCSRHLLVLNALVDRAT